MKRINWNTEKSVALKASRGICFEDVVFFIERGEILDDYIHPNQKVYPGQRIMVLSVFNYAYLVPYVSTPEYSVPPLPEQSVPAIPEQSVPPVPE